MDNHAFVALAFLSGFALATVTCLLGVADILAARARSRTFLVRFYRYHADLQALKADRSNRDLDANAQDSADALRVAFRDLHKGTGLDYSPGPLVEVSLVGDQTVH